MASSLALAHFPGLSEGHETESMGSGDRDDRRRQANRDKRLAKRKRVQAEREELSRFRSSASTSKGGQAGGKGKGKGQGKDQAGEEICGPKTMARVQALPQAVSKCKVKRVHRCMLCFSPGHNNLQSSKK